MYNILINKFKDVFGYSSEFIYLRSPGRVNLIGEHTDYNDGFVFPAAINLEIKGIAIKREDYKIRAFSLDFNELREFNLKEPINKENNWADYIKGVILELNKIKPLNYGADIIFKSNLPVSSGLSSSAAFELINSLLFASINDMELDKKEFALLCQRAENNFIGVKCGIMDQFAVSVGEKNSAIFLDTKTIEHKIIPLNMRNHSFIISNTNKPRELSNSAYNKRREECEKAVEIINKSGKNIKSLREIDEKILNSLENSFDDKIIFNRAKHVVEENKRVLDAVDSLIEKDLNRFGKLMNLSHKSLKDLYEVSCFELDILVEEALKIKGVLGSRMTGAGFGGCTISLVHNDYIDEFINTVGERYKEKTSLIPDFYITVPVKGAEILNKPED
jgi:galactokinase